MRRGRKAATKRSNLAGHRDNKRLERFNPQGQLPLLPPDGDPPDQPPLPPAPAPVANQTTTIKKKLSPVIKNGPFHGVLQDLFAANAQRMTLVAFHTSHFANYHCLRVEGDLLTSTELGWSINFLCDGHGHRLPQDPRFAELKASYDEYEPLTETLFARPNIKNASRFKHDLTERLYKDHCNDLIMNFLPRAHRFVCTEYDITKPEGWSFLLRTSQYLRGQLNGNLSVQELHFAQNVCPLDPQLSETGLQANLKLLSKINFRFLVQANRVRAVEQQAAALPGAIRRRSKTKLFHLFPITNGFLADHIRINKTNFFGDICRQLSAPQRRVLLITLRNHVALTINEQAQVQSALDNPNGNYSFSSRWIISDQAARIVFEFLFEISSNARNWFTNSFTTEGYSICLNYARVEAVPVPPPAQVPVVEVPQKFCPPPPPPRPPGQAPARLPQNPNPGPAHMPLIRLVAVDPGKKNLAFVAESPLHLEVPNSTKTTSRFVKSSEYRDRSQQTNMAKWHAKLRVDCPDVSPCCNP